MIDRMGEKPNRKRP